MERIELMHFAPEKTDTLWACDFIARALEKSWLAIVPMTSFAIKEKVWFHCHRHGWCSGTDAKIDTPTIMTVFEEKL